MKNPNQYLTIALASILAAGILFYTLRQNQAQQSLPPPKTKKDDEEEEEEEEEEVTFKDRSRETKPISSPRSTTEQSKPTTATATTSPSTPLISNLSKEAPPSSSPEKIFKLVEDADKKGKALFKSKDYLQAATCFSEALDLLSTLTPEQSHRQVITSTNNRSAMYEKAGFNELALEDCDTILKMDKNHMKARMRKLRLLECEKRWMEALVEVCALQLRYMNENRDKMRMGIPIPNPPPVPQDKIEELMSHILPTEIDAQYAKIIQRHQKRLPCLHTTLQLLQSFSGYNAWMAQAAREGTAEELTEKMEAECDDTFEKAFWLFKRGRRHAYDQAFELVVKDMEEAYKLVKESGKTKEELGEEQYVKLLEWVGMVRHLQYDLKGAEKCYEECSNLDPTNAELLVKRAGVKMDAGNQDEAHQLFQKALQLDPSATDALLHRANLYMLQQKPNDAKADLQKCLELRPNDNLARLRLATVYMTMNDLENAKKNLDLANEMDGESSEVHSYCGEMHFAKGEIEDAKREFELAMKYNPNNPTPYVNAALVVLNSLAGPMPPNVKEAMEYLEKAIQVDPQFHAAYVHLGQLKLGMATNLTEAKEVIRFYDMGLEYCRTKEELKDLVSMRILTVAQVDAASMLGMDTLNMQ